MYLKNVKGNAPNTRGTVLTGLRFFYRHVAQKEIPIDHSACRKVTKLPTVLVQEDIWKIISAPENLKHRLILMTTYSAGLRASEVRALKPEHIDSQRMLIKVENGKGSKDRYSLLSKTLLVELRNYYRKHRPKIYLFPSSFKKNTIKTLSYEAVRCIYENAGKKPV